jgi:DNA polymerase-3 subunit delta
MPSSKRSDTEAIPPVVLLVGEGQALRDAAVAEIREQVLGEGPADFNEDRFDFAGGADPGGVFAAARTLPFLASRRLVRVRGLEDRRASPFLEQGLPEYLNDPTPSTCLLLEAQKVDRRHRWVKLVEAHGAVRACKPPSRPSELRSWIEAQLEGEGKRPEGGTAAALLERVGPDSDRLTSEIGKLVLYTEGRSKVTPEDVDRVGGSDRPHAIYELTDAIGSRDGIRALRVLHRLLVQGEPPLALLAGLGNHLRRMLRARECRPLDPPTVQRALGVHPFAAQKLVEQVQKLDRERLRFALEAAGRTDRALKGATPLRPERALERLVLAISR